MSQQAKHIVDGLLDEPSPEALLNVKPLRHYYDVHVNFGDDSGYSAFIETDIAPPAGTQFSDYIRDDFIQQRIVAEAVRQGKVDSADTSDVDYVALVDAEEWSEYNTRR